MTFTFQDRTLRKIGVIGSGQIGPDIALYFSKVFAPAGVPVVVVDVAEDALQRGREKITKKLAKGVESGAFTAAQQKQMLSALQFTTDYHRLVDADLIVEAATENKELKQKIFTQLETLCGKQTLFASNSSHLEPEAIFEKVTFKGRCMVIHYFFPAERNLVVEVVPASFTDERETRFAMDLYEAIGKVPIRVKSRYGYALDPIFEGVFLAAALLLEQGVATSKEIDAVATRALGLSVGPFTAMNLTGGNPITCVGLYHYTTKLHAWYRIPPALKHAVERKTAWEVPGRDEQVPVSPEKEARITRDLQAAYFGLCCEVLDAGITNVADLDMATELALDIRPAFRFMNRIGTAQALEMVRDYAQRWHGFPVSRSLEAHGRENRPWRIPSVLREDVGEVALVTIRRPKVLNALDQGVFDQIEETFTAIKRDPRILAAVLTGFGTKAFVSGADVKFLAEIQSPAHGEQTSLGSQKVLNLIEDLGKPVVCALNGLAFGGGIELAMACTARICKADQKVLAGQPEPTLGIIPGAGGTQRLPRLIGIEKAAGLLRTGRPISSREAVQLGLCLEEVAGDLRARAVALAREFAHGRRKSKPIERGPMAGVPSTLPGADIGELSKAVDTVLCRAILEGARKPLREGLALEAKCFGEVCALEDMRIGVENFLKNGPKVKAAFVHA